MSTAKSLSKRIAGRVVAEVSELSAAAITIHFSDGTDLRVHRRAKGLALELQEPQSSGASAASGPRPTRRQLEYLEFIKKYMHRYGVSPAESDIQTHFMVSAPAVNQMVRTLERRGFIERSYDWFGKAVPRSIRVAWEG